MELKLDIDQHDKFQEVVIDEITRAIMVKLVEAGLEGGKLEEATANVAFSVASIIDDTTPIEAEGTEVHPYLGFRLEDGDINHCGENACTYEFVPIALKKLFED